jgi:hypothetical protein
MLSQTARITLFGAESVVLLALGAVQMLRDIAWCHHLPNVAGLRENSGSV